MTINMEVKKHKLEQLQNGSWKITFTVHSDDMSMEVIQAAMGAPYGLAMVPIDYDNPETKQIVHSAGGRGICVETIPIEKSEGDKLRIRAVMLCKDKEFHEWVHEEMHSGLMKGEGDSISYIRGTCNIKSRSELTTDVVAQERFRELDQKFKDWKNERRYKDNLDRY